MYLGVFIRKFETYTRYSWVADEKQKKKKKGDIWKEDKP